MLNYLNKIFISFKGAFTTKKMYQRFVIVIIGFILRPDTAGLTSMVRAFALGTLAYNCFDYFFRNQNICISSITNCWLGILNKKAPKFQIDGYNILIGDGTKRVTEGRRMPGQKKLKENSNDSGKPDVFIGHFFGSVGILAQKAKDHLLIPITTSIQQGNRIIQKWMNQPYFKHAEQILVDAFNAAATLGKSILVLDRGFLSREFLAFFDKLSENYPGLVHLILRAKSNVVGYEEPVKKSGKGRPAKKGSKVKLVELFDHMELFKTTQLEIYGKVQEVHFLTLDLIWGIGLYKKLRFVLSDYSGGKVILVTTNLNAKAEDVIVAYTLRFSIERTFKTLKTVFGGLFYHFWTKAVQKIKRSTNTEKELEKITSARKQKKIVRAFKASNLFVCCSGIALGIIQLLCLEFDEIDPREVKFQRTYKRDILSEESMRDYLRDNFFVLTYQRPDLEVSEIIKRFIRQCSEPRTAA